MKFTYTYRTSDGQRHVGEIEAESRDAAFGKIRAEMGVKPIKVTAAGGEDGRDGAQPEMKRRDAASPRGAARWVVGGVLIAAVIASCVWWWTVRRGAGDATAPRGVDDAAQPESAPYQVMTPQGPVTYRIADPLPRQTIPGNRQRIEDGRNTIFTNAAERLLARFAEPGRAVAAPSGEKPTEPEFAACLREPIRIATTDFTETVDLKRIVTGIKREMRAYINGGGTAEQYIAELSKRQRLEISYRENAEKRLEEMLSNPKEAYEYWLKANATLKSMGIYEIPIPDALKSYQAGLDLGEG